MITAFEQIGMTDPFPKDSWSRKKEVPLGGAVDEFDENLVYRRERY